MNVYKEQREDSGGVCCQSQGDDGVKARVSRQQSTNDQ